MSGSGAESAIVWVADGEAYAGVDYGRRLETSLAAMGMDVSRRSLIEVDDEPFGVDHHFLTGGATSVNDTTGWMPRGIDRVSELIRWSQEGSCTVFGVCLGAQLIAHALWPGSVVRGARIEAGLVEVSMAASAGSVVPAFHYEEISADRVVAGGGEIVARNAHSAVQGFRVGPHVGGVQFHPELDPDDVLRLIDHHASTISTYGGDPEVSRLSVERLRPRWTDDTFTRVLAGILPS